MNTNFTKTHENTCVNILTNPSIGSTNKHLHIITGDFLSRINNELLAEQEREREKTYRWIEKHGFIAHRIKPGDKAPLGDWRTRTKNVPLKDFGRGEGIGVKLGQKYGGLIDIDLDDSIAVGAAPHFVPPSLAVFGRKSNARSHHLYLLDSDEELPREMFTDPYMMGNEAMILELRGDGGFQTRLPGSFALSDETGEIELVRWDNDSDIPPAPKREKPEVLRLVARKIGAAVLLAKHVWQEGMRDDANMCLAGLFGRTYKWTEDEVKQLMCTVIDVGGDDPKDLISRIKTIEATFKKLERGVEKIKGGPKLIALLGGDPRIINRLNEWFRPRPPFPDVTDKNSLRSTVPNGKVALRELEIDCSFDLFKGVPFIRGEAIPEHSGKLQDSTLLKLSTIIHDEFHFYLHTDSMHEVVGSLAQENRFHPVRDYLADVEPKWDGKARVDRWLIDFAGAEDCKYVRAVSALTLIAAVRRVRQPGCKFDEMLVLESPQGTNKSTALATLVPNPEWFSDNLDLSHLSAREAIEQVQGYWIIEAPELKGLRKAEINKVKAFMSRTFDRGRKAYGHVTSDVPRECICIGTTNEKSDYLQDQTGNRRFWPLQVKSFDLDALRRNRDQIWAEAAHRESKGETIRLPEPLWKIAAEEQKARTIQNSFADALQTKLMPKLQDRKKPGYKIPRISFWEVLQIPIAMRHNLESRLTEAVLELGFARPNKKGLLRVNNVPTPCFVIGEEPHSLVEAKVEDGLLQIWLDGKRIFNEPSTEY